MLHIRESLNISMTFISVLAPFASSAGDGVVQQLAQACEIIEADGFGQLAGGTILSGLVQRLR